MYRENDFERMADLFLERFFNRKCKISVMTSSGNPCPSVPVDSLRTVVLAHLGGPDYYSAEIEYLMGGRRVPYSGPMRIGTFFPSVEGYVKLACIDFDDHDNQSSLLSPPEAALRTNAILVKHGFKTYLEISGGGKGQHIWIFFNTLLPAIDVRGALLKLIPKDLGLVNGENADAAKNRGVEVFPKSVYISKDGVGMAVWMPCWHGAQGDANCFWKYIPQTGKGRIYLPETFEESEFPVGLLKEISDEREKGSSVKNTGKGKSRYSEWLQQAVGQLDIYEFYGQWLTGRKLSKPGFIESCDPWSDSGDMKPSAAVQTGEYGTRKGKFTSFILGETFSVVDFVMKFPGNENITLHEASVYIGELTGVPYIFKNK